MYYIRLQVLAINASKCNTVYTRYQCYCYCYCFAVCWCCYCQLLMRKNAFNVKAATASTAIATGNRQQTTKNDRNVLFHTQSFSSSSSSKHGIYLNTKKKKRTNRRTDGQTDRKRQTYGKIWTVLWTLTQLTTIWVFYSVYSTHYAYI